ncbi:MAG TPA: hypothetical protein VGH11_00735 [Jatrophihabitans sp.]
MRDKTVSEARPQHDPHHNTQYRPGELELLTVFNDSIRQLHHTIASQNAVRLRGHRHSELPQHVVTGGAFQRVTTSACEWVGLSLFETGGVNPITVALLDGEDAGGDFVAAFALAAGGSTTLKFQKGVAFTRGLVVVGKLGTGSALGSIYIGQN